MPPRRHRAHESRTHRRNRIRRISRPQRAQEHGHEVTALVRDDQQAEASRPAARRRRSSTSTTAPPSWRASQADGAIHTASPGDETSANLDSAVADAAIEAFAGTGKPYIQISGRGSTARTPRSARSRHSTRPPWWHGRSRSSAGSSTPGHARSRDRLERRLRRRRRRDPGLVLDSPRDDAGNLIMLGSGRAALVDSPRCGPRELLPAGARVRLGSRPLRRRGRIEPDRRRTDRGGRCRSRRSRSRPRFRRGGAGAFGRLLRRSPAARSGHRRGQGSGPARLVSDPSRTRRRLPPRQLRT